MPHSKLAIRSIIVYLIVFTCSVLGILGRIVEHIEFQRPPEFRSGLLDVEYGRTWLLVLGFSTLILVVANAVGSKLGGNSPESPSQPS